MDFEELNENALKDLSNNKGDDNDVEQSIHQLYKAITEQKFSSKS